MPLYEYQCTGCGHRFERRQSFSEAAVSNCPECNAAVRRLLFPTGIVFKGSGWYKTDSRQAETAPSGDAAAPAAATTENPSSGASEAKPSTTATDSSTSKPASTAAV